MKAYEDLLYEQWRRQVEATLPTLLKRNLLAMADSPASVTHDSSTCDAGEKAGRADGMPKGLFPLRLRCALRAIVSYM